MPEQRRAEGCWELPARTENWRRAGRTENLPRAALKVRAMLRARRALPVHQECRGCPLLGGRWAACPWGAGAAEACR